MVSRFGQDHNSMRTKRDYEAVVCTGKMQEAERFQSCTWIIR
ncbi:MAG: hypothetical protein ACLUN9_10785 [Enterocloster aldenensis]